MPNDFEDLENSIQDFRNNVIGANKLFDALNELRKDIEKIPKEAKSIGNSVVDEASKNNEKIKDEISNKLDVNVKELEKIVEETSKNNEKVKDEISDKFDVNVKELEKIQKNCIEKLSKTQNKIDGAEKLLDEKYTNFLQKLESTNVFSLDKKINESSIKLMILSAFSILLSVAILVISFIK